MRFRTMLRPISVAAVCYAIISHHSLAIAGSTECEAISDDVNENSQMHSKLDQDLLKSDDQFYATKPSGMQLVDFFSERKSKYEMQIRVHKRSVTLLNELINRNCLSKEKEELAKGTILNFEDATKHYDDQLKRVEFLIKVECSRMPGEC